VAVCEIKPNRVGAQTERRGNAGPVLLLLGGESHRPPFFSVTVFYLSMRNPTAPGLTPIAFFYFFSAGCAEENRFSRPMPHRQRWPHLHRPIRERNLDLQGGDDDAGLPPLPLYPYARSAEKPDALF
jgi:hypothetical protein